MPRYTCGGFAGRTWGVFFFGGGKSVGRGGQGARTPGFASRTPGFSGGVEYYDGFGNQSEKEDI